MASDPPKHPSLTSLSESELVAQLLSDPHWRQRTIGIHGIPSDVEPLLAVPLSGLPSDPEGDIDMLLVPPGRPEQSIAVQAKRVKVGDGALLDNQRPNKLKDLSELRHQTDLLLRMGFSQVYAFVFVVVDSRMHNGGALSYAGMTRQLALTVESEVSGIKLDERVGLMHIELVQPLDDRPLGAGTYSGRVLRLAHQSSQPVAVTDWVANAMKHHKAAPKQRRVDCFEP